MKNKFIYLVVFFLQFNLYGQHQLLSTAGNLSSNDDISLSWTLGEVIINTFNSNELILTQGFQQTRLHLTPTVNPELLIDVLIYPNPAKSHIKIEFGKNQILPTTFYIIDVTGRLVQRGSIVSNTEVIDISKLNNGMYFLAFQHDNAMFLSELKFNKIK